MNCGYNLQCVIFGYDITYSDWCYKPPEMMTQCECHWLSLMKLRLVPIGSVIPNLMLTHWGWGTQKCVSKLTIIGSDNGLSPSRHQAIISTNARLLIRTSGTNFSEILGKFHTFSFNEKHLKMLCGKWWRFCLGLIELTWTSCWMSSQVAGGLRCHAPNVTSLLCFRLPRRWRWRWRGTS